VANAPDCLRIASSVALLRVLSPMTPDGGQVQHAAASVAARTLVAQGLSGLALAEALFQARLAAITAARRAFAPAGA